MRHYYKAKMLKRRKSSKNCGSVKKNNRFRKL